jgi:iron(II)-dependent oxidoreductase
MGKRNRPRQNTKRQAPDDLDTQAQVRLKPLLGVKPGTYLTVLYALAVLFVLFMLLFYKGLRDRGEYLRVTTYPRGAAVSVDGRYAGSSPCQILVKKGLHTIAAGKPFFAPAVLKDDFPGPVFGTLFVRPRRRWTVGLAVDQPPELVASALQDLAANPHIPQTLSGTAVAASENLAAAPDIYRFVDNAKYFVNSPAQTWDYVYALSAAFANGQALTPAACLRIVDYLIRLKQKYENSPLILALLLPDATAAELAKTGWYKSFVSGYREYLAAQQRAAYGAAGGGGAVGSQAVQGLTFAGIPGGTLHQGLGPDTAQGVLVPHTVTVGPFYMSRTEVSNRLYKRFVDENPGWSKSNLQELLRNGRVSADYLAAWEGEVYGKGTADLPVTGVSYYAAEAFCGWIERSLPSSLVGYQARLPLESEWEWAARGGLVGKSYPRGNQPEGDVFFEAGIAGPHPVGSSPANGYGLQDMAGNVWEWCLDWYSATKYIFTARSSAGNSADSRAAIPYGAQKVIRGGSWANEKELVKVFTRGSQPPDWCTPYLGFRVVLARARQ